MFRSLTSATAGICLGILLLQAQDAPSPASKGGPSPLQARRARIEKLIEEAKKNPARVILTVVNVDTEQPVVDIAVTMTNFDTPVLSDTNGVVEFQNVPAGTFTALFDGRPSSRGTVVRVAAGETVRATMRYVATGRIEGTITNELDEPVPGLTVDALFGEAPAGAYSLRGRGTATTDAKGHYRLDNLEPGRYYVRLSQVGRFVPNEGAFGYADTYYPVGKRSGEALRVPVRGGTVTNRIDFHVRRTAYVHLKGTVSGVPEGTRKPGIGIHHCDPGPREPRGTQQVSANLDAEGGFDVPGMLPGDYCVVYQHLNGRTPVVFANTRVTVVDRDVDHVFLYAIGTFEVTGRIELEDNLQSPMPTSIMLRPAAPFEISDVASTRVNPKDGSFTFSNIVPEDYLLYLLPPAGTFMKSVRFDNQDIAARPLRPAPGSPPLVITLAAALGSIQGRVDFGAKPSEAGIEVTLSPVVPMAGVSVDRYFVTKTDERGAFAFTGLGPGRYHVHAWREPTQYSLLSRFLNLLPAKTVEVKDGVADVKVSITTQREMDEALASF
jgi:hypothetical protein